MSAEFQQFALSWNLQYVTSSPYCPQSNGEAERAVQEAKKILSQADPYLALLTCRSTPTTSTGYKPAELAMGHCIRSTLPALPVSLEPKTVSKNGVPIRDETKKRGNVKYFNQRFGVHQLPPPPPHPVPCLLRQLFYRSLIMCVSGQVQPQSSNALLPGHISSRHPRVKYVEMVDT